MAQGATDSGTLATPSWVGACLDGTASWSLRARAPYILGLLMLFDSWDSVVIAYTAPSIKALWTLSADCAGHTHLGGLWRPVPRRHHLRRGGREMGPVAGPAPSGRADEPARRRLRAGGQLSSASALPFIQGLAIGGALPVAISYINEIAPTPTRGRFFGTFQFLMASGFGLALLVSAWVVPIWGWRPMFAIGAVPLLLLPFTAPLPESPRWLAARGRVEAALDSLARLGCAPGQRTAGCGRRHSQERAARALCHAVRARHGEQVDRDGPALVPDVARLLRPRDLDSVNLCQHVQDPGRRCAALQYPRRDQRVHLPLVLRASIDRIGRRPPVILGTALGGLALLAMIPVPLDRVYLLVGLAIVGQIGISVGSLILWPYTAEIYDTRIRSLALGTASSLARGASMLTPLLVGGVLQATGKVTLVFLVFGASSLIVALLWWRGTRETAGQAMED